MAEAVAASVSIFDVASASLKLASSLYDIKSAGSEGAQDNIESIASDLNFFAIVLEELGHALRSPVSQTVVSQKLIESITQIIENCKILFKDVNKMIRRANASRLLRIGQGVGWIFREERVKNLKATLDSLKSILGLMLQTLKLRNAQSKDADKERLILQNLYSTQQHALKRLQRVEETSPLFPNQPRSLPTVPKFQEHDDSNMANWPSLMSTVLIQAVPMAEHDSTTQPSSNHVTGETTANAIGVHVPAKSDPTQFLLGQWTQPSSPRLGDQPEMPHNDAKPNGFAPSPLPIRYHDPLPRVGADVLEGMEGFSQKLTRSLRKRMSEIIQRKEQIKRGLHDRIEAVQKASESAREVLNAAREAEMNIFEKQLLEKENKENTVRSIRLEIERSYSEFEARVRERPAAAETLQPFLAHIKRLEDRRAAEDQKLTELQVSLAEAKTRVREEFTAKFTEIEKRERDENTRSTKENEEEVRKLDEEHSGLADTLARTTAQISTLQDQWLSFLREVGHTHDIEEVGGSFPTNNGSLTPDWLDEGIDDTDTEFVEDQGYKVDCSSDKIPVEESGFGGPLNEEIPQHANMEEDTTGAQKILLEEKILYNAETGSEEFVIHEVQGSLMEGYRCRRQAWKPPQPYQSGFNTLSCVLGTSLERLWFKASRDEYRFFLGSKGDPVYIVELVPEDLRNFQTSKFEWTVLQKVWASKTALKASGYVYKEDSDGHVWIQKELNWFQIQQLFDISCSFLDSQLTAASRKILARRSEEHGEDLPSLSSKSRILPRLRKVKETDLHSELHGAFFRAKRLSTGRLMADED